jgi:FkbM family methyltransferase
MNLYRIKDFFYPNTILDIGANIGQFHMLCKNYFPESYIFSIEASNECENELKKITDNYFIGLLSKDNIEYDYYSLKKFPTNTGNSIYRELTHFYTDDEIEIIKKKGIKLDDLFEEHSEFDFIKIDTQGSELDIIDGGKNICSKAKGILLEVSITQYNQNAPLYNEVIEYMNEFNFFNALILDEARNHGSYQQDILFLNKKFFNNK